MHVIEDFDRRHVPFEQCWNFRDVGGYPAAEGGSTAWLRYFRSGALEDMHAADRERLGTLGVRTIIDLRRPEETRDRGIHPAAELGARYAHLPPLPDGASAELDARFGRAISGQRYLGYLDYAGESIRQIFEVLADPASYPLVVHCTAGKDRTGVTTAMALDLAGVDRAVIEADFELTNRDTDRWLTWSVAHARFGGSQGERNPDEERRRFGVPAEAIGVFLDGLDERYGGVRGYLGSLGLSEDVFASVRRNLVDTGGR
ncbi:MAG: tyrosine-protein phosphatase [Dehalococcoidia bacterium]|nr:tyrosine-protein phosphatase [Dehalococcoidia bacterium]